MGGNLFSRSMDRVRELLGDSPAAGAPCEKKLGAIRVQLTECADAIGGEVSARQRAARLAEAYLALGDDGRAAFLRILATEFGPDPAQVATAHTAYQSALRTPGQWAAETALRTAMRSQRLRILTQFNALPQGVRFLVDLRADLLRFVERDPALRSLDREIETRFVAWFDVGFLELHRISWNSPAVLLEKLIAYEAVHEIRSWNDLKNRLDSDRRCYAFFHPRMPMEPLIFVEVALVDELAGNIQSLLDESAPVFEAQKARTAIFYSISNTQAGLRGVSFGNFLLKRVIEDLKRDFPRLSTFSTLSPMPAFRHWLEKNPQAWHDAFTPEVFARALRQPGFRGASITTVDDLRTMLSGASWLREEAMVRALQPGLTRLAARYLVHARKGGLPYDPVARFHLGNGARIERINCGADLSENGLRQSYGLMVNYLYDPETIEANVEAFSCGAAVALSGTVRRAARGPAF